MSDERAPTLGRSMGTRPRRFDRYSWPSANIEGRFAPSAIRSPALASEVKPPIIGRRPFKARSRISARSDRIISYDYPFHGACMVRLMSFASATGANRLYASGVARRFRRPKLCYPQRCVREYQHIRETRRLASCLGKIRINEYCTTVGRPRIVFQINVRTNPDRIRSGVYSTVESTNPFGD